MFTKDILLFEIADIKQLPAGIMIGGRLLYDRLASRGELLDFLSSLTRLELETNAGDILSYSVRDSKIMESLEGSMNIFFLIENDSRRKRGSFIGARVYVKREDL